MNEIEILFNSSKIKYSILTAYFETNIPHGDKINYFFIDLEVILAKYLYLIDFYSETRPDITEQMTDTFILEFLNIIYHYKKYCHEKINYSTIFYIVIPY